MPISSILLGFALLVVIVPFVAEPLVRRGPTWSARRLALAGDGLSAAAAAGSGPAASLPATKEAALVALRDLDFDYRTGKITEADYLPLRQELLGAAAQAAQQENGRVRAGRTEAGVGGILDDPIESAVRARRSKSDRRGAPDEIEAAVRRLRAVQTAGTDQRCPECQAPAKPADGFCHTCGARLAQPARTCPACAHPARVNDKFCGKCGAALTD